MSRRDDEFKNFPPREERGPAPRVVQCAACSRKVGYSATHPYCPVCGAKLEFSTPHYSGRSEDLVTGRDRFPEQRRAPLVERRRCNRIPCRDVKACIRAAGSAGVVAEMPNVSRNGMCFRSFERFRPEARVSIATYYTEGGQNIFQDARIVWRREIEAGMSEYGVEFALARYA